MFQVRAIHCHVVQPPTDVDIGPWGTLGHVSQLLCDGWFRWRVPEHALPCTLHNYVSMANREKTTPETRSTQNTSPSLRPSPLAADPAWIQLAWHNNFDCAMCPAACQARHRPPRPRQHVCYTIRPLAISGAKRRPFTGRQWAGTEEFITRMANETVTTG